MFSKASVADKKQDVRQMSILGTPKRILSPESNQAIATNAPVSKRPNLSSFQPPSGPSGKEKGTATSLETSAVTYRDAALMSLEFIVCLEGRPSVTTKECREIKFILVKKIEQAILGNTAAPVFRYSTIKDDGLYVGCSNSTSAEWLLGNMVGVIPWTECKSKLVVVSQAEAGKNSTNSRVRAYKERQ